MGVFRSDTQNQEPKTVFGVTGIVIRDGSEKTPVRALRPLPQKRSLAQSAYEVLRRSILRGDLKPGSRVVETRVAGALKISRTPVREAIHKLEREGLLCPYPGGGFIVAEMSRADIEETFGIRCVLESYAARLAAQFHRDEELIPLEEKIQEFQECLDQGEMESLLQINTQFHDLLYGLSRSPRLIRMINDLRDPIYRFRKLILRIKDMAAASNEDHRAMLRLIRKRDSRGVELLVKEHIMKGQKAILEKGSGRDW